MAHQDEYIAMNRQDEDIVIFHVGDDPPSVRQGEETYVIFSGENIDMTKVGWGHSYDSLVVDIHMAHGSLK